MRQLKYGYFGEDEAQRIFLEYYLTKLVESLGKEKDIVFKFDKEFSYVYKGENKKDIDKEFAEAVRVGFVKYAQDIFFVGRDLDSHESKEFRRKIASMQNEVEGKFKNKTFLMIPVQCIEHWLWYIKINLGNPSSTKNVSLESKPRNDAKITLYGKAKVSNKISIPIVEEYSKALDFEYLESRSESFRTFHQQVVQFITESLN